MVDAGTVALPELECVEIAALATAVPGLECAPTIVGWAVHVVSAPAAITCAAEVIMPVDAEAAQVAAVAKVVEHAVVVRQRLDLAMARPVTVARQADAIRAFAAIDPLPRRPSQLNPMEKQRLPAAARSSRR